MTELQKQIEAAYDFRGHVTISLKDGKTVEGFIFNRQFENPKAARQNFIEVIVKGSAERTSFDIAQIASVKLTGEDFAAGKSYEDYLKKKAAQQKPA